MSHSISCAQIWRKSEDLMTSSYSRAKAGVFACLETQWCVRMRGGCWIIPIVFPFRASRFLRHSRIFSEVKNTVSRRCDFFLAIEIHAHHMPQQEQCILSSTSMCGRDFVTVVTLTSTEQRSELKTFWRISSAGRPEICRNLAYSFRNSLLIGFTFSQTLTSSMISCQI